MKKIYIVLFVFLSGNLIAQEKKSIILVDKSYAFHEQHASVKKNFKNWTNWT